MQIAAPLCSRCHALGCKGFFNGLWFLDSYQNKLGVLVEKQEEEEQAIFEAFRVFFEDPKIKIVWHNYSFDRHVMHRMVSRLCMALHFQGETESLHYSPW